MLPRTRHTGGLVRRELSMPMSVRPGSNHNVVSGDPNAVGHLSGLPIKQGLDGCKLELVFEK
jgi:hypothetical protein